MKKVLLLSCLFLMTFLKFTVVYSMDSSDIFNFVQKGIKLEEYFKNEKEFWAYYKNCLFVSEGINKVHLEIPDNEKIQMAKALSILHPRNNFYVTDLNPEEISSKQANLYCLHHDNTKNIKDSSSSLMAFEKFFDAIILNRGLCLCNELNAKKICCAGIDLSNPKQIKKFFLNLASLLNLNQRNFIFINGTMFLKNGQGQTRNEILKRKEFVPVAIKNIDQALESVLKHYPELQGELLVDPFYFISHLIFENAVGKIELEMIDDFISGLVSDNKFKELKPNQLEIFMIQSIAGFLNHKLRENAFDYYQSLVKRIFYKSWGSKEQLSKEFYTHKSHNFYGVIFYVKK